MVETISVLIITYNRPNDLLELLENIKKQTNLSSAVEEILILDNASTVSYDSVIAFIHDNPELNARYILNDYNSGVAGGRNRLMKIAKGALLLFVDDDMVFTKPDDLYRLSCLFSQPFFIENKTVVITFRVVYYDNHEVQVTAFPHKKYEKYGENPRFLTYYFAGGANLMQRKILTETGIFPEDFHYGMEEYELSYRIVNLGYTMAYDNTVTVAHKESRLGRQPNYKKIQMQWINKTKVAWRYLPIKYFISTALFWGGRYLQYSKGHIGVFFSTLFDIFKIPFTEKRFLINKKALDYLKKVEARLKY